LSIGLGAFLTITISYVAIQFRNVTFNSTVAIRDLCLRRNTAQNFLGINYNFQSFRMVITHAAVAARREQFPAFP
jgi:ABC-type transport system involved in Fe-S cluster assembly fused permease/ATPase subunit